MNLIDVQSVDKKIPIFTTILKDSESLNQYLKEVILEEKKNDPDGIKSNVKSWHSTWGSHLGNKKYDEIIEIVLSFLNFVAEEHYKIDPKFKIFNLWSMIYEEGDHAVPHIHLPSCFACVYYVDVEENASPLIFEDEFEIKPENGMLVLFPAILKHEVPPTKGKRIAISMNIENDI